MKTALVIALLAILAGCATVTPNYDAKFGQAVRDARKAQTLQADAPSNADPALGLDAKAAVNAVDRYEESFKTPPKTFEVINIGGALSGN